MKIKTKLKIIILFIIFASIVFGLLIHTSLERYNDGINKVVIANQIVSKVFGRRLLADDYLLHPGERAREQWHIQEYSLEQLINVNVRKFNSPAEKELISIINDSLNDSKKTFEQVTSLNEEEATKSASFLEKQNRLSAELTVKAQEVILSSSKLAEINNKNSTVALQQTIFLFSAAASLFLVLLLVCFWVIWRSASELEESKAKDEALLASIGDGMIALDNHGVITNANKKASLLLGCEMDEMIGYKYTDVWNIKDSKGVIISPDFRPIAKALRGQNVMTSDFQYVRKDNSMFPVAIAVSPVFIGKQIIGVIDIFRDITHEKDVDRMKSEFISLASHQLRTPLSAMKWFLEMLLAGDAGKLNDEQQEFVDNVNQSNERMIGLVNSLLNVSRIESGRIMVNPIPTDLQALLSGVKTEIENKLKDKEQTLILSISDNLPKINLDPQLIRQVYMNLLTNSIKYTPKGGEITVFVSKKDNELLSQVTDNGYGIPAKDHARLFQKFYRGENIIKLETDGNGLGMYLVKAIIESSEGKIWFESTEGKGTTFWFSLPMSGMISRKGEVTIDS